MKARSCPIILSLWFVVFCYAQQGPTVTVTGRVVDDFARPVEGASVACYDFFLSNNVRPHAGQKAFEFLGLAETKSNGRFTLDIKWIYRMPLFVARKQGLSLGWKMGIVPETTVVLGKPRQLEGVVVDGAGNPVHEAWARIFLHHRLFAYWQGDFSRPFTFIVEEIAPVSPEEWFIARTDSEGKFVFDHIPDEATADFHVEAPGYAPTYTFREGIDRGRQFTAGRNDIRIVLEPEATVAGRIVDEETGQTVSGIPLLITPKEGPYVHEEPIVSDSQGQFRIRGLPAGAYRLQLKYSKHTFPDWVAKDVEISVKAGQSVRNIEVSVDRGATIEVLAFDSERDRPIERAAVHISHESEDCSSCKYWRWTDVNGVTRFRLPPGECRVSASKARLGHSISSEIVHLEKGQNAQYTISDFSGYADVVSGRVLDDRGQLVKGARVMWHSHIGQTDDEGQFEFGTGAVQIYSSGVTTSARLLVRDESTGLAVKTVIRDTTKSGRVHSDVTLLPGATLVGRVTDPDGNGIPAAYVRLLKKYNTRFVDEVITDTQGFYRIPALPNFGDEPLTLVVRASGFGPTEIPCPSFEAGQVFQVDPIELPPTDQFVSGVVIDANDQPIPRTAVYLFGPDGKAAGQPSRIVSTDDHGRFRIDRVCEGPLRISVKNGYVDAYGGAEDIKVILGKKLVHTRHQSLAGKSLPDMTELGLNLSPEETNDKMIMLCFFDVNQRPSRNCIMQLAKQADQLKKKGVIIVGVQVSKIDEYKLNEWLKKHSISFPVGMVRVDEEKTRFTWGVRSLPRLILANREHVVTAEGFSLSELDETLHSNSNQ